MRALQRTCAIHVTASSPTAERRVRQRQMSNFTLTALRRTSSALPGARPHSLTQRVVRANAGWHQDRPRGSRSAFGESTAYCWWLAVAGPTRAWTASEAPTWWAARESIGAATDASSADRPRHRRLRVDRRQIHDGQEAGHRHGVGHGAAVPGQGGVATERTPLNEVSCLSRATDLRPDD